MTTNDFKADLADAIQQLRMAFVTHGLQPPQAIILGSRSDAKLVRRWLGESTGAGAKPFGPPSAVFGVKLLDPSG